MVQKYDFYKKKYGTELLIDLIRLESLEKYIINDTSHILTYYDITLISTGKGKLHLDNNAFDIEKNKIICSSPMQIRQWDIDEVPKGLVLIFEEEFLSTFFNDIDFVKKLNFFHTILNNPVITLSNTESSSFEQILLSIEKEILDYHEKNNHILRALLYQALAWLDREYSKDTEVENFDIAIVKRFRDLVNKFYYKEHMVNFYANNLNVSPGYLNELVKRSLRIPAKQYIQNRIFLEAKRLLSHSSLSVSEIAWKLNFEDASYFTRAFKKQAGHSPKSYRNLSDSQKVPL